MNTFNEEFEAINIKIIGFIVFYAQYKYSIN